MGQINLSKSETIYAYIGEHRHGNSWSDAEDATFNGGGSAVGKRNNGYGYYSSAGGGATDVRIVPSAWNNTTGLHSRIMVAGAGGGGSVHGSSPNWITSGGYAGGITAFSGTGVYGGTSCTGDGGGKQTTGGAAYYSEASYSYSGTFGIGANAVMLNNGDVWAYNQGGGGGGWYGGGSGGHYPSRCMIGGGGGSSYISGIAGFIGVKSSGTPNCSEGASSVACATSYTGYKFTSGSTIAGNASMPSPTSASNETGHSGNGYVRITYLGTSI